VLSVAHELPVTLINTRVPSPQEGISSDRENQGVRVLHAGGDTESEASMDNWRKAVTEPENAYDADDDEAEHFEGVGRAT
jgi:hypothetical protein